jgi:hypothetical protein
VLRDITTAFYAQVISIQSYNSRRGGRREEERREEEKGRRKERKAFILEKIKKDTKHFATWHFRSTPIGGRQRGAPTGTP